MPLESPTNYIEDLNESNPIGNVDTLDEADNHLRGIKEAVKGSFPNLGQAAVTLTAAEINALPSDITTSEVPVGGIIMYNGAFSAIPANYQLCDGTNGTPDLNGRFPYGTETEGDLGGTGGSANAIVVSHNHSASQASHYHYMFRNEATSYRDLATYSTYTVCNAGTGAGGPDDTYRMAGSTSTDPSTATLGRSGYASSNSVTVNTTGSSGTNANLPPYAKVAFIQRMS